MSVKSKATNRSRANYLTTDDVCALGVALRDVSNAFPLNYRTERDFFPLVKMYLHGRISGFKSEFNIRDQGRVDFRVGGNKTSFLELAVVHRKLRDANDPTIEFPGDSAATQAAPSALLSEVRKLAGAGNAPGGKYLLIVDLRFERPKDYLQKLYQSKFGHDGVGGELIRVVYACRSACHRFYFRVAEQTS